MQLECWQPLMNNITLPHSHFLPNRFQALRVLQEKIGSEQWDKQWERTSDKASVFVSASKLPWDSEQLGIGCGWLDCVLAHGSFPERKNYLTEICSEVIGWCKEQGINFLATKIDSDQIMALHALEDLGMRIVDCELTWALDKRMQAWGVKKIKLDDRVEIELNNNFEVGEVDQLGEAFNTDRFHVDDKIDNVRADSLWTNSLRNACRERADQVVIARCEGKVIGMVTCFIDIEASRYLETPVCDLAHVVVIPEWHSRGIGRSMLEHAVNWAQSQVRFIQIGTQVRNYAANALYGKMGFRLAKSQYSLHAHWD